MVEKRIRLLIVDNQVLFLRSITGRLHLRGYDVTVASSSKEAREAALEGQFDLAVLDLEMPGMDGERVLEIFEREHRCINIIILTHDGSIGSVAESARPGAVSHLPKPYRLDELLDVLGKACQAGLRESSERNEARMKQLNQVAPGQASPEILPIMREQNDDEK